MQIQTQVPQQEIDDFCQKWNITELALFGSVLRDDFTQESDVDVLVTFKPSTKCTFGDLMAMEDELKVIFGRDVDLGERQAVEQDANYIRRESILGSLEVIYAE